MFDYVHRICSCISKLFVKEKDAPRPKLKTKLPLSTCSTPLRPPSRMRCNNIDNFELRCKRHTSCPDNLNQFRPPKYVPIVRSTSHTSLLKSGYEDNIPFRPDASARNRRFGDTAQNSVKKQMNLNFAPDMARNNTSIPDFYDKCSKTSFCTAVEDLQYTLDDTPLNCTNICDNCLLMQKEPQLRNVQHSGFPHRSNYAKSKIPVRTFGKSPLGPTIGVMNFPHFQRFRHTITSRRSKSRENYEREDTANNPYMRLNAGGLIPYRIDTNQKFERTFKSMLLKKHRTGKLIDSTTHSQWMRAAGIQADRDAEIFKQHAGGRIVLPLYEYKYVIQKLCSIYDLDYWDVLSKMAAFEDDDFCY